MARKPADQTVQRQDILHAAAAVFQERGYERATMADIARRVKLTAGSLYHHFPAGKRDLLLAVLNAGLETALRLMDEIEAAELSAGETLSRMIETHVLNVTQNFSVGAAMVFEIRTLLEFGDEADGRDEVLRRRDEFERRYRRVIERGIKSGEFRPVDIGIFTKAMLGAHNWINVWYRPGGRLTGTEIATCLTDMFLKSLQC